MKPKKFDREGDVFTLSDVIEIGKRGSTPQNGPHLNLADPTSFLALDAWNLERLKDPCRPCKAPGKHW